MCVSFIQVPSVYTAIHPRRSNLSLLQSAISATNQISDTLTNQTAIHFIAIHLAHRESHHSTANLAGIASVR